MEPIGANMTLDSTKSRKDYDPDGIVDEFAYDFRINTFDDLVVYSDEVVVVGGYTLTGVGNVNGGDVIFDTPPLASVEVLSLRREVPLTQETAYPAFGPFPAESHEAALDYLTMICQQQQEQLDRTASAGIFPTPVEGKRLQWNASGVLVNVDSEDAEAQAWAGVAEGFADDAAAQVLLCQEQVGLCEDQVLLAEQAVLDCQDEVVLAAAQVTLAEEQVALATAQVVLATAQADDAAASALAAANYDPNWDAWTTVAVTSGSLSGNISYRRSRDSKNIQFKGRPTVTTNIAAPAGTTIYTLPVGWRADDFRAVAGYTTVGNAFVPTGYTLNDFGFLTVKAEGTILAGTTLNVDVSFVLV